MTHKISFEKITLKDKNTIFQWLNEPHMQEFWDNSEEHKEDILNFIDGRKKPSNYFNGIFTYWIGIYDEIPFCLIMTSKVELDDECPPLWKEYFSKTGNTYSLDFGIGNKELLGKGLAAPTLDAFTLFFKNQIDPTADTFFIDPDENNPRAQHVYKKAGFNLVGTHEAGWNFPNKTIFYLMVKELTTT